MFNKYSVDSCNKLEERAMQETNRGGRETPYSGRANVPTSANIKIDNWNVKLSIEVLLANASANPCPEGATDCGVHKCTSYVEDAIAGICIDGRSASRNPGMRRMSVGKDKGGKALWYDDVLEHNGFEMIKQGVCNKYKGDRMPSSEVVLQAGDIAVIDNYTKYGHACMWTGSEWVSDYNQGSKKMSPYGSANGNYKYAIFRYHAKDGKVTVIQG
jgi:hypothetical protein